MSSRRNWTQREDQVFRKLAEQYEPKNWAIIAKRLASEFGFKKRTGKQCRQRWYNHLDPGISKKVWTKTDEELLLSLHKIHGNKWTIIAQKMTGRSDNSIKNYFYSTVRRNLRRMGKLLGSKNSTGLMRQIKPSTMTRIFGSLNEEEDQNLINHLQRQGLTKDFLKESCQNIRNEIIQFSSFKPKKNDRIEKSEKEQYERVFWLLKKVNQIYEQVREEEKSQRTDKQLFRHYYQEMNRESSQEQSVEDSMEIEQEEQSQIPVKKGKEELPTRSTRGRQLKSPKRLEPTITLKPPVMLLQPQFQKKELVLNEERQDRQLLSSSTLSRPGNPQESGLASIVEFAQQLEFNDPDFNIEIGDDIVKPNEEGNNFEINMSNMSFKSPAYNNGTPLSQVNFFKSPRNIKITCLNDYLMRLSNSYGRQSVDMGMSSSLRSQDKFNSAKKQKS